MQVRELSKMCRNKSGNDLRVRSKMYYSTSIIGCLIIIVLVKLWQNNFEYLTAAFSIISIGITYYHLLWNSEDMMTPKHVIVLTGCDSGLGYSLAIYCKKFGATVVAGVLQINGPAVELLRQAEIIVYQLDITDRKSVNDFRESLRNLLKQHDLVLRTVINNAGVMIFGEFEWQTEDQMMHQISVNLMGTMRFTRTLMPEIRAHGSRIILISSHCSIDPLPGIAVYGATKSGLQAWATALRVELKKYKIDVVSFIPGSFVTQSNIIANQVEHFETMKNAMSQEVRMFYGDYFSRYVQYLTPLSVEKKPNLLENAQIYKVFRKALLSRYPAAVYKCEPWRYFFYHTLFKLSPTFIRDKLILSFMQFPSWRDATSNDPIASRS